MKQINVSKIEVIKMTKKYLIIILSIITFNKCFSSGTQSSSSSSASSSSASSAANIAASGPSNPYQIAIQNETAAERAAAWARVRASKASDDKQKLGQSQPKANNDKQVDTKTIAQANTNQKAKQDGAKAAHEKAAAKQSSANKSNRAFIKARSDSKTLIERELFQGNNFSVHESPKGTFIWIGSQDALGKDQIDVKSLYGAQKSVGPLSGSLCVFSPNEEFAAIRSKDSQGNCFVIYSTQNGQKVLKESINGDFCKFSLNGELLFVRATDAKKQPICSVYSIKNGKKIFESEGYHGEFSSNGKWITLSSDSNFSIRSLAASGEEPYGPFIADACDFSPDGNWITVKERGKDLYRVCSLQDLYNADVEQRECGPWQGQQCTFSENSSRVVMQNGDDLTMYSLNDGEKVWGPLKLKEKINTITFNEKLIRIDNAATTTVYDLGTRASRTFNKGFYINPDYTYCARNEKGMAILHALSESSKPGLPIHGTCVALTNKHMIVKKADRLIAYELPINIKSSPKNLLPAIVEEATH